MCVDMFDAKSHTVKSAFVEMFDVLLCERQLFVPEFAIVRDVWRHVLRCGVPAFLTVQ